MRPQANASEAGDGDDKELGNHFMGKIRNIRGVYSVERRRNTHGAKGRNEVGAQNSIKTVAPSCWGPCAPTEKQVVEKYLVVQEKADMAKSDSSLL